MAALDPRQRLDAAALHALVSDSPGCAHCAELKAPGWESVPGELGPPLLEAVGTLRDVDDVEPGYEERHEDGTGFWHPRAPIALDGFPYNRASVWRCPQCRRGFLQYTEAGGYYVDHRLRAIDPALIRAPAGT
ncbi:hypothetical protein ABXN37_04155 [Piscinibacter sakaiensis]|uniref:Uncharacterized protein n=1 Tax=Piscinibacter sakaiensis TaxID=1547922 RepID=A0A0K8NVE1_PISS1|nr:hypothetical protein [Piscinibacter sakaiensis]GAP34348.1 hypothetical protein ISF6_4523 [Piscinibacter sakaiensis]